MSGNSSFRNGRSMGSARGRGPGRGHEDVGQKGHVSFRPKTFSAICCARASALFEATRRAASISFCTSSRISWIFWVAASRPWERITLRALRASSRDLALDGFPFGARLGDGGVVALLQLLSFLGQWNVLRRGRPSVRRSRSAIKRPTGPNSTPAQDAEKGSGTGQFGPPGKSLC